MTTKEMLASKPCPDYDAMERDILDTILQNDQYIFYRSGVKDNIWTDTPDFWEMYCTACGGVSGLKKRRDFPASRLAQCPRCGAKVKALRWMRRAKLKNRVLYYTFVRGEGAEMWLYAYYVTQDFCPEPEDTQMLFDLAAVYRFAHGEAEKWTCKRQYEVNAASTPHGGGGRKDHLGGFGREINSKWEKCKNVTKTIWQKGQIGGVTYPAYIGTITWETIRGSCLAYSQLDLAVDAGLDIPEYLALYVKYPACEYLWKMGLGHFLYFRQQDRQGFRRAVNLRADRPDKLLRGLTRQEIRYIAQNLISCQQAADYRKLRQAGVVRCDDAGWTWAQMIPEYMDTVVAQCAARGLSHRALRAYIERQAARANRSVGAVFMDYRDYLRQNLTLPGADEFDLTPQDLQLAHERLSARLRTAATRKNLAAFRLRRRQLRPLRFAHGDYLVRPVDSPMELISEGEQQHNCVAGYEDAHAQGDTAIFVLRRRDAPRQSWHTVEIDEKALCIRQLRGAHNADATPEAEDFAALWLARARHMALR